MNFFAGRLLDVDCRYLRYANTCALAVRQALKEPARAKVTRHMLRSMRLCVHPVPPPPCALPLTTTSQAVQRGESFLKVSPPLTPPPPRNLLSPPPLTVLQMAKFEGGKRGGFEYPTYDKK